MAGFYEHCNEPSGSIKKAGEHFHTSDPDDDDRDGH